MAAYIAVFFVFAALTAACWFVSIAVYQSTVDDPDVTKRPDYEKVAFLAILMVTLMSFILFPRGYYAGIAVWCMAAYTSLGLSATRGTVLFAYLATSSLIARLVVIGIREMFFNN